MAGSSRRRGVYAPLASDYYEDEAIIEAGASAELLYIRGLAYCARSLTDGFISVQALSHIGCGLYAVFRRATKLEQVGLWVPAPGSSGWMVRNWLKWNRSRDEITAGQSADRERKRRSGSDRNPSGIRREGRPESVQTPAVFQQPDTYTDTGNPAVHEVDGRPDSPGAPGAAEIPPAAPGWMRGPGPGARRAANAPAVTRRLPPDEAPHDWRAARRAAPPPSGTLAELREQIAAASARHHDQRKRPHPGPVQDQRPMEGDQ